MIFNKKDSDTDLMEGILAGGVKRERSTKILFQKHHKFCHRGVRTFGLTSEEAQEAYLDAITAVCRQIEKSNFRGDCSLSTYLYRIFENKCKNKLRQRKSPNNQWIEDIPDLPSKARSILEELVEQEEFVAAEGLLALLGGKCKQILLLSDYQGYSQTEIAEKLGLKSARVVATSRYRCIAKLKQMLRGKQVSLQCEFSSDQS